MRRRSFLKTLLGLALAPFGVKAADTVIDKGVYIPIRPIQFIKIVTVQINEEGKRVITQSVRSYRGLIEIPPPKEGYCRVLTDIEEGLYINRHERYWKTIDVER